MFKERFDEIDEDYISELAEEWSLNPEAVRSCKWESNGVFVIFAINEKGKNEKGLDEYNSKNNGWFG